MEQDLIDFVDSNLWIFPIVTLSITLVINRIINWYCKSSLRKTQSTQHVWRHALLASINAPLRTGLWLLSLEIIRQRMLPKGEQPLLDQFISPTIDILSIVLLVWFVLRFVENAKANYLAYIESQQQETDQTAIDALAKIAWACVLTFAAIAIMQQLDVPLASLLAFGGAAGIAAGFAAQTLVANLLGGLTIYASRIFKIGEDIIFPGTELAGTVQHIGWRATKVLGWNGRPIYVPNALFNSSNMVNHSRLSHRMISEHILLRYEDYDKVRDIIRDGNHFLEQQSNLKYFVFQFDSFGDRALKLLLYAWVQNDPPGLFVPYANFMKAKQALMLNLADIALSHGCTLILPASTIHLHDKTAPFPEPPSVQAETLSSPSMR